MEKQYRPTQEGTGPTRRAFLQRAAAASLATAAGAVLIPTRGHADAFDYIELADELKQAGAPGSNAGDIAILNFALTLERLEATFYNLNANQPYLANPVPGTALTALPVGSEVSPAAVTTSGVALARFTLSPDRSQLFYEVRSTGLSGDATVLQLRRGLRGASGDIAYTLAPPVNGVSTGFIPINAADVDTLLNQGFYLNIGTPANPEGELRGQVIAAPPGILSTTTPTLKSIVDEIRDHENAHVSLLEQVLGANAQPAPQFQNLEAATLLQFLQMAQTFEDVGVSAYVGAAPQIQNEALRQTVGGIMAVEARHAGGLRAYRKVAAPAEGGDPSLTLTEDRENVNRARSRDEVLTLIQPFLAGGTAPVGTQPGTGIQPGNGTQPGTAPAPVDGTPPGTSPQPGAPGTGTEPGTSNPGGAVNPPAAPGSPGLP